MSLPDPALVESRDAALMASLAPVRAALLAAARAEAERTRAGAESEAAATLAAAEAAATRIRDEARAQGAASGAAAAAAERNRAQRAARTEVRRAQRDAYERLRTAARREVSRLREEPDYPRLCQRLAAVATGLLGEATTVREAPGGGVIGEVPGRRVDCSLTGFAERAVQAVAGRLTEERAS